MKIDFIDNVPHITPETQKEEDQLFDWYEKVKGKRVDAVISFEWLPRALAKTSDEDSNCNKPLVSNLDKLKELVEQQQDIDPEIQDAVNKIYWDLI